MSAEKLLEQLEKLGIDQKVLSKIRSQVAEHGQNSPKAVKPQAILKYLTQKGILSEAAADRLAKSIVEPVSKAAASEHDDIMDLIEGVSPFTSPTPEKTTSTPPPTSQTKPEPAKPEPAKSEPAKSEPAKSEPLTTDRETKKHSEPAADRAAKKSRKEARRAAAAHAETVFDPPDPGARLEEAATSAAPGFGFDEPTASRLGNRVLTFKGKKDKRNQWATKWLYVASMVLGLLGIFGVVLAIATISMGAEEAYRIAKESYDRLSYADAAKKFKEYYTAHPNHKEVGAAKTYEAMSVIRSLFQNKAYDEAIRAADAMLPPLISDPLTKIDELRDDIAVVLPRSLYLISEEAKNAYKLEDLKKQLERCQSLKQVIDNVEYIPTSQRNKPTTADYLTKIEDNIRAVQTQIDKEERYQVGLVEITNLGSQLKTKEAFAVYRDLTRNFGDLAAREELRNAIREVSLKEQELVKPIETNFSLSQANPVTPVSRSFVLYRPNGEPKENLKDEVFAFLAEGSVYAMRGSDGAILWRQFVGYQTEIQPQSLKRDRLMISDQQNFGLSVVDATNGQVYWRLEIGEPFLTPSFNETMVLITTKSGKLIKLDPMTGSALKAAQLPQPASVPALISDQGALIYQPGSHSNLYALSKEDLSCRGVFYLGHEPGSIAVPPVVWSGYVVTAVNRGNSCDVWVFRPNADTQNLDLIQVMNVFTEGIVTAPITRLGNWIMIANELGEIQLLELLTGEKDQSAPVTRFAHELFENNGGRTFLLNEGNNIWIAGTEFSRVKLQRAQTKLTREKIVNAGDLFLAPLQSVDDYVFHVRRRKNSGMLSASLVDKMTLEPVWRVDFGGMIPGPPIRSEGGLLAVSNQGDLFTIDSSSGLSVPPSSIASRTVESLRFSYAIPLGDGNVGVLGIPGQSDLVYGNAKQGVLLAIASPAETIACKPLLMNDRLIVPSAAGPIVRINPTNGRMDGDPFLPPISSGKSTVWFEPTALDENRFAIAKGLSEGNESMLYVISTEDEKALAEAGKLTPPFPLKSRLASDGELIFGAIEGPSVDQMLVVRTKDLSAAQQVDLPGRVVAGPWLVGDRILVKMDSEKLVLFDKSMAQLWDLSVQNDQFAGAPEMAGDQLIISFQSGQILAVNPTDGSVTRRLNLRQPIVSQMVRIGESLFCSGLDGTIHEIDLSRESGGN